jgi:hypothetical protein
MTISPKKSLKRVASGDTKASVCSHDHKLVGKSSDYVHIKIPGKKAYHCINIKDDEKVSSLKARMAKRLGVDTKNWGIYVADRNEAPEIVDDEEKISKIDHNRNIFFYPRIIIR